MIQFSRAEALACALGEAIDAALAGGVMDQNCQQAIHSLVSELQLALGESAGVPVELRMQMSLFVHGERTMAIGSIRGRSAITFLRVIGLGGLTLGGDLTPTAAIKLLEVAMAALAPGGPAHSSAALAQALASVPGVNALPPSDDVRWSLVGGEVTQDAYRSAGFELQHVEPAKLGVVSAIERAVELAAAENVVDLDRAREASQKVLEATEAGFADVLQVAERPEFDVFTVQHSLRVSLLTTYVAKQMGVPREGLIELTAAAMFHDVGKGRVPDEVLYKPGRLDDDEAHAMRQHPRLGAEILLDSRNVSPYALGAAWGHHIRFDGRGYPETRPWFKATRATSLIQVCDVYEALTARRPYKPPYSPARAYQILFSDPGAFDPAILAAFTRAMGLYPPGRFVALSDGRLGRVASAGAVLDRPLVKLFPDGELLDLGHPAAAHVSVTRLVEEPDLVRILSGEHGDSPLEEISLAMGEGAARDEEFSQLTEPEAPEAEPVSLSCGHGDDCRLC